MQVVIVQAALPSERRRLSDPSYPAVAAELARRGHGVTLLVGAAPDKPEEELLGGVQVVRALAPREEPDLDAASVGRQCRALRRALRRQRDSVVLFADAAGLPPALLAVDGARARWIDLGYDWALSAFAGSHPWWTRWEGVGAFARLGARAAGAPIERPDARAARFVVFDEERWKSLLVRGLPVQSARVLTAGIDTRLFGYREPTIPTEGPVRLHHHGALRRSAGLNAVFLALQRLPERVCLRLVADATESSYLAELAEIGRAAGVTGRVEVVPAPTDARSVALLREAHVFVHAAEESDPFPRRALEAASCGVPVVAASGTGDAVFAGGALGGTFAPGNPLQLTERVSELLAAPAEAVRRCAAARREVEARWGASYTADRIEPLLADSLR